VHSVIKIEWPHFLNNLLFHINFIHRVGQNTNNRITVTQKHWVHLCDNWSSLSGCIVFSCHVCEIWTDDIISYSRGVGRGTGHFPGGIFSPVNIYSRLLDTCCTCLNHCSSWAWDLLSSFYLYCPRSAGLDRSLWSWLLQQLQVWEGLKWICVSACALTTFMVIPAVAKT